VFLSTNNGTSWTAVNTGLTSTNVHALAVSGTNLFAGTRGGGVFLSSNNGISWTAVNAGLTSTFVRALAESGTNLFAASGSNIFAGTHDGGVWRRPLSEMITDVVQGGSEMPTGYALQQNYPNPFNPTTTIKFELPQTSEVRLSVYDLLGREVSVVVNEKRNAGVHEVKFDGTGLSSCVYFYRIQAGDFTQTKRLLLLK
jgi:hypothetical protein